MPPHNPDTTKYFLSPLKDIHEQFIPLTPEEEAALGLMNPEKALSPDRELPEFRAIREREAETLKAFFGYEIAVPPLPVEKYPEILEKHREWQEQGFALHYLPNEDLTEDRTLPGWQKKPGKQYTPDQKWGIDFFAAIQNGDLPPDASTLPGSWVLWDTRKKPPYNAGKQLYPKDALIGPVLEELREKGLIQPYTNAASRFNVSKEELEKPQVKEALAKALGVNPQNLRIPRTIEENYLGNARYKELGDTDTWEWYDDLYQKSRGRLCGGNSGRGGLSYVHWHDPGLRNGALAFRPLVVFS